MCKATSRSGVLVVLKIIAGSNERQFLQSLGDIKAPSNHTIPLLDVIDLSTKETIIVLPWKFPLDQFLRRHEHPKDVVSLCLQFIEGVDFLHQHNVAHCDLKPGNVVVDYKSQSEDSPRLWIIDFELALSVESEETMSEGWCGTPPWIAPELGTMNGPIQRYSPILADRWVCGRMIEYFTRYFHPNDSVQRGRLLSFAQRLLNVDPKARPELNRLLELNQLSESNQPELSQLQGIHGPRKRKAAKSHHDSAPKRYAINRCVHYCFTHCTGLIAV